MHHRVIEDMDIPMVSSTSAARGAVVAKVRTLGTRRDRAAARNSCGRMIAEGLNEGGDGGIGGVSWTMGQRMKELFKNWILLGYIMNC